MHFCATTVASSPSTIMVAVLLPSLVAVLGFSAPASVIVPQAQPCITAECVFNRVAAHMMHQPPAQRGSSPILRIEIGDASSWIVDSRGQGAVYPTIHGSGSSIEPDAIVAVDSVSTLFALLDEKMSFAKALAWRKLRLRGNLSMLGDASWLWPSPTDAPLDSIPSERAPAQRLNRAWKRFRPRPASGIRAAIMRLRSAHANLVGPWLRAVSAPVRKVALHGLQLAITIVRGPLGSGGRRRRKVSD